ncbi:hypothetical protein GCM10028803_10120 [Larkinella knui]|nr:alpha/beta hydrolase [Larkinella knui]
MCLATGAYAQLPDCDAQRYSTAIFSSVTVTTGVKYGQNTTVGGVTKNLLTDIYQPVGDASVRRPLVILAFGGSFLGGQRTDMDSYARKFAQKGYVVATIDYRLYDGFLLNYLNELVFMDEVVKAVSDMKAAVRFFRKDASTINTYGIEPNYIIIGGYSAGAITALHAGYVDAAEIPANLAPVFAANGGINGNTDDPANSATAYSSEVQGVWSLSGAINSKNYIDACDPPLFMVHGDQDAVVPYGSGFLTSPSQIPFVINITAVDGSSVLATQATAVGVPNQLYTVAGGGHNDIYANATVLSQLDQQGSLFLKQNVACATTNCVNISPSSSQTVCEGSTVALSASVTCGTSPVYSWSGPNNFTSTVANPTLANATTAASGSYTVIVSDAGKCSGTAVVAVTVNPKPLLTLLPGSVSLTGCNCNTSTVVAKTTPAGTAINWSRTPGGNPLPNAGTGLDQVTITQSLPSGSFTYQFIATLNGCQTTGSIPVLVP